MQDHKRRLARFKAHIESDSFPAEHLLADARWVASQLDKAVLERLSYQTQVGGKKAGTVKPSPDTPSSAAAPAAAATTPAKPTPSSKTTAGDPFFAASPSATAATTETPSKGAAKGKGKAASAVAGESSPAPSASSSAAAPPTAAALARKAALVAAAEEAGTSVREQVRLQKKERSDKVAEKKRKIKEARKEKNERIKKRKIESGEGVTCVFFLSFVHFSVHRLPFFAPSPLRLVHLSISFVSRPPTPLFSPSQASHPVEEALRREDPSDRRGDRQASSLEEGAR